MIPEGKKPQLGIQNQVDRLSDLPDSIIHHVISFLETKEACRTTILSKRWSNIWPTSQILDFQPQYFIKDEMDDERNLDAWEYHPEWFAKETYDKYLSFIEATLQKYSMRNLSIRKLTLKFLPVYDDFAPKVDTWLEIAVKNQVEDLSLCIAMEGSANYKMPTVIFSAKSLKSLSCFGVDMGYYEPDKLASLKCLSLYDVTIEGRLLQQIINTCPLNMLLVKHCHGFKSILIPQLSKLKSLEFWRAEKGGIIHIDSSHLANLTYYSSREPSWPCKILTGLASLKLTGAVITDDILTRLLTKLVAIERLGFHACNMPENIHIHGSWLKELVIEECNGLSSVTVNAPNLCQFVYNGETEIALTAINIPAQCKVYFLIEPETYDTDWFVRLKQLLSESNICQVLTLLMPSDESIPMVKFNEEEGRKICQVPPYKLEELRISLPYSVSELSSFAAFVDGLLWSCRPDKLSIPVCFRDRSVLIEPLFQLLRRRVRHWRHPLRRVEVIGADCTGALGCAEVELYCKLYW